MHYVLVIEQVCPFNCEPFLAVPIHHHKAPPDHASTETHSPHAAFQAMMLAGLLNPEHEAVRINTFKFGERLAQSGQGHLHLLEMLSHLGTAEQFPYSCGEYYRLLTEVVRTIANMPAQVFQLASQTASQTTS